MSSLRRCPFCGSDWIEISDVSKGVPWVPGGMVRVQCVDCGCCNETFSAGEEDKAAEWWNGRLGDGD